MGFTEGCDRLGNCVLGEEQALGAVGAFSDAPVDGVSAWLLPFHEVGTEAEGEGPVRPHLWFPLGKKN